ncbi:LysR family transcriptional regulator [Streptosporangium nondiastaticum]|uniref:LysR family transcriptional regulator n=1 Tax=Streptosporangium nondiastaticum TaxID=35764 RepID=A0A9X7PF57_9ACTN|nr:RidA family protein [Streptosporangium nondiastaticum]PSJ25719.1 LysR family transcriptional regulator [Streptosporangium nondiastaticum]
MPHFLRDKLSGLGIVLPAVSPPKGVYVPAVRSGRLVQVSGQVPMVGGELVATGRVGAEVTPDQARELSRQCGLAALVALDSAAGRATSFRVLKVVGYVASAERFLGQERVVDGASELFLTILGDAGGHARSVVGVGRLPLGAPVEIEVLFEVDD